MELSRADDLKGRLDVAYGHAEAISESRVKYSPGEPLAMAEEAVRRAQQSARACMTIIDQVRRAIENDVAAARAEQNARALTGG